MSGFFGKIVSLQIIQLKNTFLMDFKKLNCISGWVVFALATAMELNNVPVVFAKKSKSKIVDTNNAYMSQVMSFTRGFKSDVTVDKRFLKENIMH
mgnify:CR=1 FL=1